MKTFFKNKFDLIMSIGADCACTSYLRRLNLQIHSYPLDWLTNAPFKNRVNLLCCNFDNFLNLNDLEQMPKPTGFPSDINHDYYKNNKNLLYFWHDFQTGVPLEKSYYAVNEKYQRRIKRLYFEIEKSNKILFIYLAKQNINFQDFIEGYQKLKEKFKNKDIYLLVIENSDKFEYQTFENNHILKIKQDIISDDKKHHYDITMGNKTNCLKIFKQIKLNLPIKLKIKRIIYSILMFLINLIFIKKIRRNLKDKLKITFYHAKL